MKIKEGLKLRKICGETVVCAEGRKSINMTTMIQLNPTSAYLWEKLEGKEFTAETMADLLCEAYDVEREVALSDSLSLCEKLREAGAVED